MALQMTIAPTFCALALLLTACKPDMDRKIIEAEKANAEARCACLKEVDYDKCLARATADHPVIRPEDGFAVKYSASSVEQYDAAVKMSIECSQTASKLPRPK